MLESPIQYWDDVIFCDETKMMLYYNDGPSRLQALNSATTTEYHSDGEIWEIIGDDLGMHL